MILKALLFLLVVSAVSADNSTDHLSALRFGNTLNDYVQFTAPDMTPFTGSLTITAWLKSLHDSSRPIFLHYFAQDQGGDQFVAGDNGYFNWLDGSLQLLDKFPSNGVWFHYAMSWTAGGMKKVYINGEEVGSNSTSSTKVQIGGDMALGNRVQSPKITDFIFGGELTKLFVFDRELTASEIQALVQSGMCSTAEKELSENIQMQTLDWSFFLSKERSGEVNEFILSNCLEQLIEQLNNTKDELENLKAKKCEKKDNSCRRQLKACEKYCGIAPDSKILQVDSNN